MNLEDHEALLEKMSYALTYPDSHGVKLCVSEKPLTFSVSAMESINSRMKYSEHLKKDEMLCKIKKVIFNNPATIVIWANGDKTVVKCDGEKFDPEKGLAMAIIKYLLDNNHGYYYDIFNKWLPKKKTHSKKTVLKAVEKVRKDFDKEQVVRKYEY